MYNACLFVNLTIFNFFNGQFLYFSFYDATRRVYLMRQVSKGLEGFNQKRGVDIKMPVINFLDRESLLSWLEARRLVLEIGARFQTRIQYYTSFFLVIFIAQTIFIFAVASGLGLSFSIFTLPQWAFFATIYTFFVVFIFMVLVPNAYLNKEMQWQIKRLLKIK